jgi:cytochrome c biogenesis protein CcdA
VSYDVEKYCLIIIKNRWRMRFFKSLVFFIFFCVLLGFTPVFSDSPAPPASDVQGAPANISDIIGSAPQDHVVVYFFYNQHCGECQKALTFLEGFRQRHPEVIIRSFDIANNPENQQLFQQFNERYGVPFSPVPAAFTGDWELMGYENIEAHLDEIVMQNEANLTSAAPGVFPMLPSMNLTNASNITLPLVIVAGLLDGINPCAFSVLVFLLVSIMAVDSKRKMLATGFVYIGAVFLFYFLSGLGLFAVVQVSGFSRLFAIVAASVALIAGVLMIKEAFSPGNGRWLVIPESKKGMINKYVKEATLPAAFILGILVGMFELPCTGGIYLAIISMMSQKMTLMAGLPLLLLYNFLFVVPLIIILAVVYFGLPPGRIETWRSEQRFTIRLAMGCLMIAIGLFVLLTVLS